MDSPLHICLACLCLIFLVTALTCSVAGEVQLCKPKQTSGPCSEIIDVKIGMWVSESKKGAFQWPWLVRFMLFLFELLSLAMEIVALVDLTTLRSMTLDKLMLTCMLPSTCVAAIFESCYASGLVIPATKAYSMLMGGTWAASAAFLWISLLLAGIQLYLLRKRKPKKPFTSSTDVRTKFLWH